jgi:hypothetical protein
LQAFATPNALADHLNILAKQAIGPHA